MSIVVAPQGTRLRIGHVSTFPPLRCGIATFASDLMRSMPFADHRKYSLHYGVNEVPDAAAAADVRSPEQLVELAKCISTSNCEVVSLQHEFGIWGGAEGENILPFLEALTKPVVCVLHTTFGRGVRSAVQVSIISRLVDASARVIVLTDLARSTLDGLLDRRIGHVAVIPHGVPDVSFVAPQADWAAADEEDGKPFRIITPGFFRADKGLEVILLALWQLVRRGRKVSYLIAGEPQRQFAGQSEYRTDIEQLVTDLHLGPTVRIDARYLSVTEQVRAIQDCHAGIFAYQDHSLASSGTIPLVLSAGRPVICTPFEYALAKQRVLQGVMVAKQFGASAIADSIASCMDNRRTYPAMARVTYDETRDWLWSTVGLRYANEYELALQHLGAST